MACGLASFIYCTPMVVLTALKGSEIQLIEDSSLQAASCCLPHLKWEIKGHMGKAPLEGTQWDSSACPFSSGQPLSGLHSSQTI